MVLNGRQRAYLRGLGHRQEPVVFVGKAGITPELRIQLEDAIQTRELIKCRIQRNAPGEPAEIARSLAEDSRAELLGVVGRNFLLYRRSPDKPRIQLPEERR